AGGEPGDRWRPRPTRPDVQRRRWQRPVAAHPLRTTGRGVDRGRPAHRGCLVEGAGPGFGSPGRLAGGHSLERASRALPVTAPAAISGHSGGFARAGESREVAETRSPQQVRASLRNALPCHGHSGPLYDSADGLVGDDTPLVVSVNLMLVKTTETTPTRWLPGHCRVPGGAGMIRVLEILPFLSISKVPPTERSASTSSLFAAAGQLLPRLTHW